MTLPRSLIALSLCSSVLLTACGGGDDPTTAASTPAAGGTLELSVSKPSTHNGNLDTSTASTSGVMDRKADSFSTSDYCEAFWENITSATSTKYAIQVYYTKSDKKVLHASIVGSDGWSVFENNKGAPITGVSIDATAKTLGFDKKVLNGIVDETSTVNGTTAFPSTAGATCNL